MRYTLPTDRIANQLVPHYLSGRRYILFLQSLIYPLYSLNMGFREFAREKLIEAHMTTQHIYFDWYVNRKFRKYFKDDTDRIIITENVSLGVDIYHEGSLYLKPFTVWYENEPVATLNPEELPKEFYFVSEDERLNSIDFIVHVPEVTVTDRELVYMLSYVVNTYKIASTTFLIKINNTEFDPIKNP